jgi:hypothetical protein
VQYRDFVFRKMFEQPAMPSETRADEIVRNVRELSRLDPMYDRSIGYFATMLS